MDWATHPFYKSFDHLCNPQQTISKFWLTIFVAIVYLCICAAHITAGWYDWLAPSLPSSSQVGLKGPPTLWLTNWDCEDSLESRASHAATRAMAEKEILLRWLLPTLNAMRCSFEWSWALKLINENDIFNNHQARYDRGVSVLQFSRNVSELETVQRAIHHIPELLDAAMAAMMETNIQPPEVEVTW